LIISDRLMKEIVLAAGDTESKEKLFLNKNPFCEPCAIVAKGTEIYKEGIRWCLRKRKDSI
jgi:hypothetical protein